MIYAKIYLESNGDLVLDSVKEDVEGFVDVCQKKVMPDGSRRIVPMTEIKPSTNVVCSPEAKRLFTSILDPRNPNLTVSRFDGELALFRNNAPLYRDSGLRFCFRPDKLGETRKIIKPNGKVYLSVKFGADLDVLDDFRIVDNEFIKNLDISKPVDEEDIPFIGK